MPARAARTLAPAPSAPPSGAERGLLAPARPRHRPANAGAPAELSASPAARPVKPRSVPGRDAGYPAPPGQIRTCALAHTAPLPGMTVGAETHPAVSARTSCATGHPAQCPAHVESSQIPRESGPWLLRLRRGSRLLVRRSHSYYGRIRLLHGVHQRRTASTFPLRPPRQELSRGHRGALPGPGDRRVRVHGFFDTAGPGHGSPVAPPPVLPSTNPKASAPQMALSMLNSPARAPRYRRFTVRLATTRARLAE